VQSGLAKLTPARPYINRQLDLSSWPQQLTKIL